MPASDDAPQADRTLDVAIVGAGPAGLFAAEHLAAAGLRVAVFERMPSPARKLLMAGRGGLNLTHSEPLETFLQRYRPPAPALLEAIRAYPPVALAAWADGLGAETFTGSSGRIFPKAMKASPLLRAWLARLDDMGVTLHVGHALTSLEHAPPDAVAPDAAATAPLTLTFTRKAAPPEAIHARAVLLALGGASWPRLGADGSWVELLHRHTIAVTPLSPANAGLLVPWSAHVRDRFAGAPLKRVVLSLDGERFSGELTLTRAGLEGTPAYAAAPLVRARTAKAPVGITLDLRPDLDRDTLVRRLSKPRARQSLANVLRKTVGLTPPAIALLHEPRNLPPLTAATPAETIADRIKALPLLVTGLSGLERAISTAGGIAWSELDGFMLRRLPGVFAAGEMIDWEAPTGGYLLQACFSTAHAAARQITRMLEPASPPRTPIPSSPA